MIRRNFRDESGFSLIQLLVALALIGFTLASAYGLYFLGVRMYARGNSQAVLQQAARAVDLLLTRELTYAHDMKLHASLDSVELHGDYTLLYSDAEGVWIRAGAQQPRLFLSDNELTYGLSVSTNDEFDSLLDIIITICSKTNPAQRREVQKTISLFNTYEVDGEGTVIQYKKNP